MQRGRLFLASCVSLVTTSMVFAIRGDIEGAMSSTFQINAKQMGTIWSPAFWAFTIAIYISGAIADLVGLRALHVISALGYFLGVALVVLAPHPTAPVASIFDNTGTTLLYAGFFVMGLSQGLVEGVINPLVATIYSGEKTKWLNRLHAWWPGGQIIGGLLAVAMTQVFNASWQLKLATILVPAAVYLVMALTMEYPQTERVQSKVSTGDMWSQAARPLFILLFLVYTAGLVFVLRTAGSGVAHKAPISTLVVCSILTGIGLYWLGGLQPGTSAVVAFAAATVFGIGKSYFWPTMIGVTAEQFPRGGALLISIMGGTGMLSVAVALPLMGERIDKYGPGAALQMVAILGAILAVVFGGLWLYFRSKGGYRAVELTKSAASA